MDVFKPNVILIDVVLLFFQIYCIISVKNKFNFYLEIHFGNFNLAFDCLYTKIDYINGMKRTLMEQRD